MKKSIIASACLAVLFGTASAAVFNPSDNPLVRIHPVKPNILMVLDTSGSMSTKDQDIPAGLVPGGSAQKNVARIEALRLVVINLLGEYRHNAYIGYTSLGYIGPKANTATRREYNILKQPLMDLSVQANYDSAVANVNTLKANGNTPLAWSLYEAIKYIRGEKMIESSGYQGTNLRYISPVRETPIRYRCQEQHMLLLTDGQANTDGIYETLDTGLSNGETNLGKIGQVLHSLDLRTKAKGLPTLDDAGQAWNSKGSKVLNPVVHTIVFGTDKATEAAKPSLKELAKVTEGVYEGDATNTSELLNAFQKIFQTIIRTRSGTGAVEDQNVRTKYTVRYSSSYNPALWNGRISASVFSEAKDKFDLDTPKWTTEKRILPNQGKFITASGELSSANLGLTAAEDKYINWLKGVDQPDLRTRKELLGDIIDSHIAYSAKDRLYINAESLSSTNRDMFVNYLYEKVKRMPNNLLITGSNDGLVNFIIADKGATEGSPGERYAAYFPSFFASELQDITRKVDFKHRFRLNGPTSLFDAFIKTGSSAKFISIGATTTGSGRFGKDVKGRGLVGYQLFSADDKLGSVNKEINVLYEITNSDSGFADLGYTYSSVEYFNQSYNGSDIRAVGVFGNGFGVDATKLYMINAVTGSKIKEIEIDSKSGGASSPALLVKADPVSGYQYLDAAYVGDYSGKLWKVKFKSSTEAERENIELDKVTLLFNAGSDTHPDQYPIAIKPMIAPMNNTVQIYFGTGIAADEDLHKGDPSKVNHRFYGVTDNNAEVTLSMLTKQAVSRFDVPIGVMTDKAMYTTTNAAGNAGWYITLADPGKDDQMPGTGERIIRTPVIFANNYIHFTTWGLVEGDPNDPCNPDELFGKVFVLNRESGASANLEVNKVSVPELSGFASVNDAYGIATGPAVQVSSPLNGAVSDGLGYLSDKEKEEILSLSGSSNSNNSSYALEGEQIVTDGGMAGDTTSELNNHGRLNAPNDDEKRLNRRVYFLRMI